MGRAGTRSGVPGLAWIILEPILVHLQTQAEPTFLPRRKSGDEGWSCPEGRHVPRDGPSVAPPGAMHVVGHWPWAGTLLNTSMPSFLPHDPLER